MCCLGDRRFARDITLSKDERESCFFIKLVYSAFQDFLVGQHVGIWNMEMDERRRCVLLKGRVSIM